MLLPFVFRPIPRGGLDAISPYGYPGPVGAGTDDPAFLRSLSSPASRPCVRPVSSRRSSDLTL